MDGPRPPISCTPTTPPNPGRAGAPRLNVLLSASDWQEETWADRLPRLLEPMGVNAFRVHSGREASELLATHPIHIAVVDLALPLDPPAPAAPRATTPLAADDPTRPHTNTPAHAPEQQPPRSQPSAGPASNGGGGGGGGEGGHRILQLLARQPHRAPTLVIKRRKSQREDARELTRVLAAGAFAVLERPVNLEIVLCTLHRALERFYADAWPNQPRHTPRHT